MISISLCMIVRNEERVLGRCLESVKDFADEIVIVDTGSGTGRRKLRQSLRTGYSIIHGGMIFLRRGISPWIRVRENILCGWMRMM